MKGGLNARVTIENSIPAAIPQINPRRIANNRIGTIAPSVTEPPCGNEGKRLDIRSRTMAIDTIIAPSARTGRETSDMINYREPINRAIADMNPRIGAKNPPPIKSIKMEPITMC